MRFRIFILLSLLTVGSVRHGFALGAEDSSGQILLISSYSPIRENGTQTIKAFTESLAPRIDSHISVEYMDEEASPDSRRWSEWMSQLFRAYDVKPKMVVITGGEAWEAYNLYCTDSWRDIPVVLGSVKKGYIGYAADRDSGFIRSVEDIPPMTSTFGNMRVTGYYLTDYFEENLRLIKALQPGIRHVAYIYDDRYSLGFFRSFMKEAVLAAGFESLVYLSGTEYSTAALLDTLSGMDETYALLSAGWFVDSRRYPHAYSVLNNELSGDSTRIMYMVSDFGFKSPSELGGYYVSGPEIGRDLAELAYDVFTRGIENSPPFGPTPSQPKYHIDYQTLTEAGLNPALVPEGTVFYGKPVSPLREYAYEIAWAGVLFVILVGALFYVAKSRRNKERFYRDSSRRLWQLVSAMPDMAVVYDAGLNIVDIINPVSNMPPGIVPSDIIGKNVRRLPELYPSIFVDIEDMIENLTDTRDTGKVNVFSYNLSYEGNKIYLEGRAVPYDDGMVICFIHDATVHVTARREIAKLQSFLQSVVDNLPVGLHVKDASDDFRYVLFNTQAYTLFENYPNLVAGKNDYELGDPMADAYRQDDLKVLDSDEPLTFERVYYSEEGHLVHGALATKTKLVNDDGSCYIITVLVDQTDARQKELELEDLRKKLSIALDAGALSAYIYDVESGMYSSLYNQTVADNGLSMKESLNIIHPDFRARYEKMMSSLTEGKVERVNETLRFYRDGMYQWYETYAIALTDPDTGKVVSIVGTEKNITQAVENDRKLKEYVSKLDMIMHSDGLLPWDYDVPGDTLSSPDPKSAFGPGISMKRMEEMIHPEDLELVGDSIREMVEGRAESVTIQIRFDPLAKDYRWMEIHAVVLERDREGKAALISGLRKDITEKKLINEELIRLRDKAEESNRLKSSFLANMSHEIRTPLNAIVGFSSLLSEPGVEPSERKEYCGVIEANSKLLLTLINDILDLSKIEAGTLEFSYGPVELHTLLSETVQLHGMGVETGGGVRLVLRDGLEPLEIYSDRQRLVQVVTNFVTNAFKFTRSGSIEAGYTVEGDEAGKWVRVYVSDTGCGIEPGQRERVFERFVKLDSFKQGTGLGLSICRSIVEHLGGRIGVESTPGEGSTFWFTVPLNPPPGEGRKDTLAPGDASRKAANTPPVQADASGPRAGGLILIAEDNADNYRLFESLLGGRWRLAHAWDGVQAVEMFSRLAPELVLMDIKMPEMDGYEAARRIRRQNPRVPIVAVTAYAFEQDEQRILSEGFSAYISKPLDPHALIDTIQRLLPRKSSPIAPQDSE